MELVSYGGWDRCAKLTDGGIELIATLDVGPRIIRFGFAGGPNEMAEAPDEMGRTGGDEFRLYGGHRLWISPEVAGRADLPDNDPVAHEWAGGKLTLTAPIEKPTNLQREIVVSLQDGEARLEHRIHNRGLWAVRCAPWSISIMAPGGEALVPQEPYRPHSEQLLAARPLVLWAYTDMSDPRWTWGRRLIRLRQDPEATTYQKIGARVSAGWAAYRNGDRLFVKRFPFDAQAEYPDFGCNFETFTRHDMLELESVGPLQTIEPGGCAVHVERWRLFRGIEISGDDEADERRLAEPAGRVGTPD